MNDFKNYPPMQFKLTSDTTMYDIFSNSKVVEELIVFGLNSQNISSNLSQMKISILPDAPCTIICNDREYDAPDFYATDGFVNIKNFKIKESNISFLVTISIR